MKISIITVSYNSEKTIKDTLESVLAQSYDNYEYLIIDGNSTDNTLKIVEDFYERFNGKLKYISEKDNGLYDAMNKGIKLATGDIIGIINSDDVLAHENVFKNVVDNIQDSDGVYSDLIMLDENLNKVYRIFKSHKVTKKLGWHMPHPTLYLKKEIYEKYGSFDCKYKIAADLDFMLRIINSDVKLKYVNDCFVFMRSGGVSTNGIKSYFNSYKESNLVMNNNRIKFKYIVNIIRIFNTFYQRIRAILFGKNIKLKYNNSKVD